MAQRQPGKPRARRADSKAILAPEATKANPEPQSDPIPDPIPEAPPARARTVRGRKRGLGAMGKQAFQLRVPELTLLLLEDRPAPAQIEPPKAVVQAPAVTSNLAPILTLLQEDLHAIVKLCEDPD